MNCRGNIQLENIYFQYYLIYLGQKASLNKVKFGTSLRPVDKNKLLATHNNSHYGSKIITTLFTTMLN